MKPHYPFSGTDLLGTRRTGSLVEHPDGTVFIIEYIRSEPLWFRCKRETIKPEFTTTENPNPES